MLSLTYRLREPLLAVRADAGRGFATLAVDYIVTVESEPDGTGCVNVVHEGEHFRIFKDDLIDRATPSDSLRWRDVGSELRESDDAADVA